MRPLLIFLASFLLLTNSLNAGEDTERQARLKQEHLLSIHKNIEWLEREIKTKKKSSEKEAGDEFQKTLQNQIRTLNQKLSRAKITFSEVASGMSLGPEGGDSESRQDLLSEFRELMLPALDSFKRLSARPRKIEKLRSDVSYSADRVFELGDAIENIEEIASRSESALIRKELESSLALLEGLQQEALLRVNEFERKLEFELGKNKSFLETLKELLKDFFQNRGKNLFFSLATFIALCWFMLLIKNRITRRYSFPETLSWVEKPVRALYGLLTLLVALAGALLSLYLFNDWVLFTFVILSLSIVLWSVHSWIPRFVHEGKFVLNLGTVKEGELVVMDGIPWMVKELGIQSILENGKLQGGRIRVAASRLMNRSSRRVVEGEPWFPVSCGEWVLLGDKTFGEVVIQTPEQVNVRLPGGAEKYYPASQFLSEKPVNLSRGFRLETKFALDYNVKERVKKEVPEIFRLDITRRWQNRFEGKSPDFRDPIVELHSAGRGALYLWVKVDCNGRLAGFYFDLQRELQGIILETCIQNGYQIPLAQLRVHTA